MSLLRVLVVLERRLQHRRTFPQFVRVLEELNDPVRQSNCVVLVCTCVGCRMNCVTINSKLALQFTFRWLVMKTNLLMMSYMAAGQAGRNMN